LFKNPIGPQASGVFLLLVFYSSVISASPFQARDQNPFKLIQGLPFPVNATLPDPGDMEWSVGVEITNTLNFEATGQETLLLDYEAYQLNFGFRYGLNKTWALKLDIPLLHRGGGILDNNIDTWHRIFGLPRANRPNVVDDQFQIAYVRNGVTQTNITSSAQGLGDIQLSLGYQIYRDNRSTISTWLITDLPAGDQAKLTGNEKLDVSLLLAAKKQLNSSWALYSNVGSLFPGSDTLVSAAVEQQIWFGHAGVKWAAHESFDIKVQVNGHTRFYKNSGLRALGSSNIFIFGGSIRFGCSELDIAVSEDTKVEASPDVSFLINWKNRDCN